MTVSEFLVSKKNHRREAWRRQKGVLDMSGT
jgi:hypothetical protein